MKINKKENLFLNGNIESNSELIGPFTVELDFDRNSPGYKHKKGTLYTVVNENAKSRMWNLFKIWMSGKELSFNAKYRNAIVELKDFHPTSLPHPDQILEKEIGNVERICEFTFSIFSERDIKISKEMTPQRIIFHLEDIVLFRPTLKGTSSLLGNKDEPKELNVSLEEFENSLKFEVDDLSFETDCSITAPITLRDRYQFSVSSYPLLVVESKSQKLTKDDMIKVGDDLLLLLSFLEERFIKYISLTILYNPNKKRRPLSEFLHTHHSKPMGKPWRNDLEARQPMDKFSSLDIKNIYQHYKFIAKKLKINFAQVFYLYLSALHANMIYYNVVDFYSCIDKIIDIYPKIKREFHYVETENEKGHKVKVKQLCDELEIEYNDLPSKDEALKYIPIRHSYIHFKQRRKHTPEEIWNAAKMAGYLARRLIFSLLGLNYKNYNSCNPQKRGRIGL